jgi:hypothetical protein
LETLFSLQEIEQGIVRKTVNSFGCSLKFENRTKYAIDVFQGSDLKDRIPPSSYLLIPNGEYVLEINKTIVSKNEEPFGYVGVKRIDGQVKYEMGSTTFSGSMEINGDVNISNSQIDVVVQNDLNANITNSELNVSGTVAISNAELNVSGSVIIENETLNANITNTNINATITNATLPISGNVNAMIENAEIKTDVINNAISVSSAVKLFEYDVVVVPTQQIVHCSLSESGNLATSGVFDTFVVSVQTIGKDLLTGGTFFYRLNDIVFQKMAPNLTGTTHFSGVPSKQSIVDEAMSNFGAGDNKLNHRKIGKLPIEELVDDVIFSIDLDDTLLSGNGGNSIAELNIKVYAFNSDQTEIKINNDVPIDVEIKNTVPLNVNVSNLETEQRTGQLLSGLARTTGEFNTGFITKPKGAKGILLSARYLDKKANMITPLVQIYSRLLAIPLTVFNASFSDIPLASSSTNFTTMIFHEQGDGHTLSSQTPATYYKKVVLPNYFAVRIWKGDTGGYDYDYVIYYEWLF